MSITTITTPITEKGTAKFTVAFTDETGASVIPKTGLNWTLTDRAGTVINSRSAVVITPAASVTIVLSGADLAISASYAGVGRVLTVQGTYDSDIGSALPLKEECWFWISDLVAVN